MSETKQTPIFFVIGPAGSGKSSLAKALAVRTHGAYLDKDVVCNKFTGALLEEHNFDPSERDSNAYYRDTLMPLEYDTLLNVGAHNAQLGIPVIFDAPFGAYFSNDGYIEDIMHQQDWPDDVHAIVIHIIVDGETVHQRLIERGLQRDAWKLEHWQEFWPKASGIMCKWRNASHITINNDMNRNDFTQSVDSIMERIHSLN